MMSSSSVPEIVMAVSKKFIVVRKCHIRGVDQTTRCARALYYHLHESFLFSMKHHLGLVSYFDAKFVDISA